MLAGVQTLNLAVRFLAEFAVIAAVGYWGFTLAGPGWVRPVAGLGAPLLLVLVWALWGAPRASMKLEGQAHLILDVVWFGSGAVALWAAGKPWWALVIAVVYLVNLMLIMVWKQA